MKKLPYFYIMGLLTTFTLADESSTLPTESLDFESRTNGKKTLEPFLAQQKTLQESTVVILVQNEAIAYGSIMSPEGLFLTKASVLTDHQGDVTVRLDKKVYKATLIASDESTDLALLQIEDAPVCTPLSWDSKPISKGSIILSNSSSTRSQRRIRLGIISTNLFSVPQRDYPLNTFGESNERKSNFPLCFGHDITLHPSQMGGPVLNLSGKCIGLNIAKLNKSENLALPASLILNTYKKLLEKTKTTSP